MLYPVKLVQHKMASSAVEGKRKDEVPGEANEDPSINKEEEDTKKSINGRDQPKGPAIDLHYDALVPNGHIDSTRVHKIMGYKIKTEDEMNFLIAQWQDWKKEVRIWAAYEIKDRMKLEALKSPDDDNFITPKVDGRPISKFLDIKKW